MRERLHGYYLDNEQAQFDLAQHKKSWGEESKLAECIKELKKFIPEKPKEKEAPADLHIIAGAPSRPKLDALPTKIVVEKHEIPAPVSSQCMSDENIKEYLAHVRKLWDEFLDFKLLNKVSFSAVEKSAAQSISNKLRPVISELYNTGKWTDDKLTIKYSRESHQKVKDAVRFFNTKKSLWNEKINFHLNEVEKGILKIDACLDVHDRKTCGYIPSFNQEKMVGLTKVFHQILEEKH